MYPETLRLIEEKMQEGVFPGAVLGFIEGQEDGIHVLGNAETKMKFLTDFIDLGYTILSIGDLCIRVFVFIVIYNAIKKINSRRSREVC